MYDNLEFDLDEAIEHIVECWDGRLKLDESPHPQLAMVWPDGDARRRIINDLLGILSLDGVHQLPADIIRLAAAGEEVDVRPSTTIRTLLVIPFIEGAEDLITAIMAHQEVPDNVVPIDRKRLH